MNSAQEEFLGRFRFRPELRGCVGVEIEYFLTYPSDGFKPAPDSPAFLEGMGTVWGYELSACQVEHHTQPASSWEDLRQDVEGGLNEGRRRAGKINRGLIANEVAPEDMSLDIYPSERYLRIAARLPIATLRAACQVAGTHIHIGVANIEEAIAVHDRLSTHIAEFLAMGDHSGGERVRLYQVMAPEAPPPPYVSVVHYYQMAEAQRFTKDPRSCYHFIRINPIGTVEVRAFGTTDNVPEIIGWAKRVKELAQ